MEPPKHLRIGVFIPGQAQLLDLSPIDLFGMLDPAYLSICKLPPPLVSLGVPSTIHYISVPEMGAHVELTASAFLRVSKTINDPEVEPGMLDILLVPGPPPFQPFGKDVLAFLQGHADFKDGERKTDVLSVCTGACLLAQAGVLKGKKACGMRGIVGELKEKYPDTLWDEGRRWVQDDNIWSSGELTSLPAWNLASQTCDSLILCMVLMMNRWNHEWTGNGWSISET